MNVAMGQEFDHADRRSLQMALNEKMQCKLMVDGVIGPKTIVMLKRFQTMHGLRSSGVYDTKTQELLEPFIERKYLRGSDYIEAAEVLGCKPAVIRAVVDVLGCSDGFYSNGKAILCFERHLFYQMVVGRKNANEMRILKNKYPDVIEFSAGGYCYGETEYGRFAHAASVDSDAAMRCTRWGMFELLGGRHKAYGYDSVMGFVAAMQESERNQLAAFVRCLRANETFLEPLRKGDLKGFIKAYVGPSYKENNLHVKLFRAMRKHEQRYAKQVAAAA